MVPSAHCCRPELPKAQLSPTSKPKLLYAALGVCWRPYILHRVQLISIGKNLKANMSTEFSKVQLVRNESLIVDPQPSHINLVQDLNKLAGSKNLADLTTEEPEEME